MSIISTVSSGCWSRCALVAMRGSLIRSTSRASHILTKSSSLVGTTIPQPVAERHRLEPSDDPRIPGAVAVEEHLVAGRVHPQERDRRVGHGEVDVLASVAALPGEQRCGDRLRGEERGDLVSDGLAEEHRSGALGVGLVHRDARVGLDGGVVGAAIGVGPDGPVSGDRDVDEVLVDLPKGVVAEPEPVHDTGPEVLDHHVGLGREPAGDLDSLRVGEVEGDRALAAVAGHEQGAHLVDGDAEPAGDVADAGPLDLHHRRALVGQQGDGVRPAHRHGEVEDLDAPQGRTEIGPVLRTSGLARCTPWSDVIGASTRESCPPRPHGWWRVSRPPARSARSRGRPIRRVPATEHTLYQIVR